MRFSGHALRARCSKTAVPFGATRQSRKPLSQPGFACAIASYLLSDGPVRAPPRSIHRLSMLLRQASGKRGTVSSVPAPNSGPRKPERSIGRADSGFLFVAKGLSWRERGETASEPARRATQPASVDRSGDDRSPPGDCWSKFAAEPLSRRCHEDRGINPARNLLQVRRNRDQTRGWTASCS